MDGTRLAAGCFDGTVVIWQCDVAEDSMKSFRAKEHSLAVFDIIWNRWNRNLLATRSRDEVLLLQQRLPVYNNSDSSLIGYSRENSREY